MEDNPALDPGAPPGRVRQGWVFVAAVLPGLSAGGGRRSERLVPRPGSSPSRVGGDDVSNDGEPRPTPPASRASSTLVLPTVGLTEAGGSQPISTIGITAVQRTTIAGPPPGQSTTLQVIELIGTAEAVEF